MKLHSIKSKIRGKSKQRIGRGGKRGSYSGRGTKGQKSRAGRKLRPAQRDLILRLPKLRGFRNKIKKAKAAIFNLKDLALLIKTTSKGNAPLVINRELFVQAGMIPSEHSDDIKILSQGNIESALIIEGILVSKSTKEKIEKAGGSVK